MFRCIGIRLGFFLDVLGLFLCFFANFARIHGWAQAEGFQTLWLGVWEFNTRAIEFYHRQGFVDVGNKEFMLGSELQTDLIMQLDMRC